MEKRFKLDASMQQTVTGSSTCRKRKEEEDLCKKQASVIHLHSEHAHYTRHPPPPNVASA